MKEQPSMADLEWQLPPAGFDVLLAQRDLQARIHREADMPWKPLAVTEAEFLESFRMNVEADAAEIEEIRDRLPWKSWKAEHRERIADGVELSAEARLEIQFELIDRLHFLLNLMIKAGFTSWQEVESWYWTKNRENVSRQERGY